MKIRLTKPIKLRNIKLRPGQDLKVKLQKTGKSQPTSDSGTPKASEPVGS